MGEREQVTATVILQGAAREITVYFLFWNWLALVSRDLPTSTPSHRLFLKCLQNVMARSRQWDRNVKQCVRDSSSSSCHNFIISAVWSWLFFVYRSPRCTALPYCKNEPQLHRNSSLLHFALPFPNRIECTTVGRMTITIPLIPYGIVVWSRVVKDIYVGSARILESLDFACNYNYSNR